MERKRLLRRGRGRGRTNQADPSERTLMTDTAKSADGGFSRRRLLGGAAAAGGIAAASLALPPNVRKVLAAPRPSHRRLADIKHVVMLMQENRSFDHYYGTLSGVRGFSDPHPARLPNGRPVFLWPRPVNPRRVPYALPAEHAQHRGRGPERCRRFSDPVGRAALRPGRRQDGQLGARPHRRRRRGQRPVHHGLLHPAGHPVPVRPGRRVHGLRQLLLLGRRSRRLRTATCG